VRRLVPWALVVLVAVAGLVGALVGVASQPSASGQLNLSEIIAATRAAGTARFTYSAITSSSNPLLRSTSYGKGTVDFTTQSVSTVEYDRQTSLTASGDSSPQSTTQTTIASQIVIGGTSYNSFNTVGLEFDNSWIRSNNDPVTRSASFGVLGDVSPIAELASDVATPGARSELLGSATLGTTLTTRYRLLVPTCNTEDAGAPRVVVSPTDLCIDDHGRLVQARSVVQITLPKSFPVPKNFPAYKTLEPGRFAGTSTIASTIRLFDFGGRVAISAPTSLDTGVSTSQGIAISTQAHQGCVL